MAEHKKTFIFYSDWTNLIGAMSNEDAGGLIKHILAYVNDENPETENPFIKMAFAHMKPILQEDLKKWDKQLIQRSEAGKKSAAAKKRQRALKPVERVLTDNANDNENENKEITTSVIPNLVNSKTNNLVFALDNLKAEFINSHSWLESIRLNVYKTFKQKVTTDQIIEKVDDFILYQKTQGVEHLDLKKAQGNFANWIIKKMKLKKATA